MVNAAIVKRVELPVFVLSRTWERRCPPAFAIGRCRIDIRTFEKCTNGWGYRMDSHPSLYRVKL